jgi:hypothetical protein
MDLQYRPVKSIRQYYVAARLEAIGGWVSLKGRGRVFENIFIECLWRPVKCE